MELENIIGKLTKKYTPEYLKELSIKHYEEDRSYPENFSNWYPHIKNFGEFKTADIINNQIFTWEETEIMRQTDNIEEVDWNKIEDILKPSLDKMEDFKMYSIKNGCFSNKFEFNTCVTDKKHLAKNLWKLNYTSCMYDTGGYTELVVRELIPFDNQIIPTIYNGMPLYDEVRVFYNMDTKQIEYMVDYWDYDYCYNNINNLTDKIVFNWFHNKIPGRNYNHIENLNVIQGLIKMYINKLEFDNTFTGVWSIDFMPIPTHNINGFNLYLIDMARGFRSAYWDSTKLKEQ